MKLPLSTIEKFIAINKPLEKIADTLTFLGLEVDGIENNPPSFSGVVTGKILTSKKHPNADRLSVAEVTDGKETYQVVCAAPNCRAGLITAFAKIGAVFQDEKPFKIKKSKLRDIESYGMLCSKADLNISKDNDGIVELPENTPLGEDIAKLLCEPIIEISLTPNLGHCTSALGVARELAASYRDTIKNIDTSFEKQDISTQKKISATVINQDLCSRYSLRYLENIKVGPSPLWLQTVLENAGMRPINNIVDVTNYVMLLIGQPMHAFDFDKIQDGIIEVCPLKEATDFSCLDGLIRKVPENTLMICDKTKQLAIAGIIGGQDSCVTDSTTKILLEAAIFDSSSIRRSTKKLSLRTESSIRFEKKTDPNATIFALDLACHLLQKIAGAKITKDTIDIKTTIEPKTINCRLSFVKKLLGLNISLSEIEEILNRLDCKTKELKDSTLEVSPPSYRNDLNLEIDLIEEIARIYGYNHFSLREEKHISSTIPHSPIYLFEKKIREFLVEQSLTEWITCDLISPKLSSLIHEKNMPDASIIEVMHAKSVDNAILRPSLLPSFLEVIRHNLDHNNKDLAGFEIGKIHYKKENSYIEIAMLSIVLSGNTSCLSWDKKGEKADFYDIKGILENLLNNLGVEELSFFPSTHPNFHPFRQADIKIGSVELGVFGEVHPNTLAKMGIKQKVYYSECNLELLQSKHKEKKCFITLPAYPSSERDLTITIDDRMPVDSLLTLIKKEKNEFLEKVFLLDLYKNESLSKDTKNITFRFVYRAKNKTLSFDEVERAHQAIAVILAKKVNIS